MVYGSETWAIKVEDMKRLDRAEKIMVWCVVSLRKEKFSNELLGHLEIVSVADVVRKGRSRWYGHVEWKEVEGWVSKCLRLEVQG